MKSYKWSLLLVLCAAAGWLAFTQLREEKPDIQLDKIKLPTGFKIELFAENVTNARSMCLTPSGTLFVGTRDEGSVYALVDQNGDHKADKMYTIAKGLQMPNGVAFKDGSLYVAEVSKIWRFDRIEQNLTNPPKPVLITDKYPDKTHHGWKYIAFGPDGKLYVPVGAPCNVCESEDPVFNTITRINPDGSNREIVARGVRNSVGFTWHPQTKELWFTDNGRDWMGDDAPSCELNHLTRPGEHFGFPYCHQGDLPDPKFGAGHPCSEFTPPAMKLGPHVAPLGVEFYTGNQFPTNYKNQLFIAEHGSWNRANKIGYRIALVHMQGNQCTSVENFAEGWLQGETSWGRPVDIEWMPDGSMLVSDDQANAIYRISYQR
ncbi:MAG: sorbosone dehydrogenase family protein [Lewinellaceae bacterium]|nr:sorbosone dehydrogenase family protein [Lewinellaceae bacterium]HPR00882.1 sorbosone dehydrogenase family protein [Saprospiraceae bacterium]HQU52679.1 sorbosone dehydrogenase family protein [Saprospiraceae bacterium]